MKLYNTLTRSVDPITPLNPPIVTVYTCGPTVYDYAHIGHWFNYVRMDTLIRALKLSGLQPKWVMNITDVGHLVSDADEGEDKLEKGAKREGKTAWEVAEFYTEDFLSTMQELNILQPDHIVKATEHIPEQIALIQKLEEKGYTYVIDDGVYYDTSKFEGYASFARLDLDSLQAGARVSYNTQKKHETDFALWKFSPKDHTRDMEWDSPWGTGFPGWHIECSAMSMKYLGDTLDIHTGGIDHIPVHHTNEIAQSEAATGKRFAQAWMHSNHVMVDGEKISKSLGNGIRLNQIVERGISAEAVRLQILESHYRSQAKFSWASLEAAQNRLKNWQAIAALQWQPVDHQGDAIKGHEAAVESLQGLIRTLPLSLADDLDTPQLLARIDEVFGKIEKTLLSETSRTVFSALLKIIDEALGIQLAAVANISSEHAMLIREREKVRSAKDWAKSDELRDQLTAQGVGIRDTPHGTIWFWL
jgi:cysteinyl-tRNA synthetase